MATDAGRSTPGSVHGLRTAMTVIAACMLVMMTMVEANKPWSRKSFMGARPTVSSGGSHTVAGPFSSSAAEWGIVAGAQLRQRAASGSIWVGISRGRCWKDLRGGSHGDEDEGDEDASEAGPSDEPKEGRADHPQSAADAREDDEASKEASPADPVSEDQDVPLVDETTTATTTDSVDPMDAASETDQEGTSETSTTTSDQVVSSEGGAGEPNVPEESDSDDAVAEEIDPNSTEVTVAASTDDEVVVDPNEEEAPADDVAPPEPEVLEADTPPEALSTDPLVVETESAAMVETDSPSSDLSREMIQVLVQELHYRRYEAKALKPHIAAVVIKNRLHRPQEGIPAHWFLHDTVPHSTTDKLIELLPRVIIPTLLGALAVTAGLSLHLDSSSSHRSPVSVKSKALARTPVPLASPVEPTTPTTPPSDENEKQDEETPEINDAVDAIPVLAMNEHTSGSITRHPHSVKPGKRPPPPEELDETWLDKAITAVERKIKSFFGMKI